MVSYCYFCETQRCRIIAAQIERMMDVTCFSPKSIQRKWIKGHAVDEYHDWLPGYVFLYSETEINPVIRVSGIIRLLGGGPLRGADHDFAMNLLRTNGVMGHVKVLEEGDRCVIHDPVWEGLSGRIIKLDRNRKRCCVEFCFDETKRTIWVGYDVLDEAKENT